MSLGKVQNVIRINDDEYVKQYIHDMLKNIWRIYEIGIMKYGFPLIPQQVRSRL